MEEDGVAIRGNGDGNVENQINAKEELGGRGDENVLQFLDSLDGYLTLMDSLNSTLREGWLDLASARHSMGASRINSGLLDLKFHPAATSLQVTKQDESRFNLCKWASSDGGKVLPEDEKSKEGRADSPQLRYRGSSGEKPSPSNGTTLIADEQVKKERSKSLSVFGALVSPKLRSAQLSFETAVETLVEIANVRASLLSAFDRVNKELEIWKN